MFEKHTARPDRLHCLTHLLVIGVLTLGGCDGPTGSSGSAMPRGAEVVAGTTPAEGATDVAPDAVIRITFETAAVPGSEDGSVFADGTGIDIDVEWEDGNTTMAVRPLESLQPGTTYTVRLEGLSFADGSELAGAFTFQFTVSEGDDNGPPDDTGDCQSMECPFVESTSTMAVQCVTPAPCTTNVSTTDPLIIEFTIPFNLADLAADILSETGQSFAVAMDQSADGRSLTATPTAPLLDNHTYSIFVEFVSDTQGQRTEINQSFCFSTGATLNCPTRIPCAEPNATDAGVMTVAEFAYERPFGADSVWNTPIGDNPALAADSDVLIAGFSATFEAQRGIFLGVRQDAFPVYIASPETPRVTVQLTDEFATRESIPDVPLPNEALPDCGFDTFLSALDPDTGQFYEFWRAARNDDGTWRASSGNVIDAIGGSGIYPGNGEVSEGVRASGFSALAGMIWPHELEAGLIDHALVFVYFPTRTGGPVPPAVASDGAVDDPAALPMGTHLQLDPALDLDALGLDPWERAVGEAMQRYGMYLGDTGTGIGLSMLHVYSFEGNPYEGLMPESAISEGGVPLDKFPPERFRVLDPD